MPFPQRYSRYRLGQPEITVTPDTVAVALAGRPFATIWPHVGRSQVWLGALDAPHRPSSMDEREQVANRLAQVLACVAQQPDHFPEQAASALIAAIGAIWGVNDHGI